MKPRLFFPVGVFLFAFAGLAAIPAVAQTTAPGPYYAKPSWDQKLQCDTRATCPRFIVLSNWNSEAVLDRETGLVWEQSPSLSIQPWPSALRSCNDRKVGNRKGWRLPTIQELASLLDLTPSTAALPAGHPFSDVGSSGYWSATSFAANASLAWFVFFGNGAVRDEDKGFDFFAWCVRGGQGVDPQ